MKVEYKEPQKSCMFSEIDVGKGFTYEVDIYIKCKRVYYSATCTVNACNLQNGSLIFIPDDCYVMPKDIKVIVNEKY